MNIKEILANTPRLRAWADIGPVQRAELEQFAHAVLEQKAQAITADGVLVAADTEVWIFDGIGSIKPTSVRSTEALTNYYLFGNIPVAHSFSTREAADAYRKQNASQEKK